MIEDFETYEPLPWWHTLLVLLIFTISAGISLAIFLTAVGVMLWILR